jgi:putative Mg2+ transporter-C (MgtC) family protein
MPSELEIGIRILVAAVAGMVVGLEREFHGQAAGIRTHGLVACGAALFTVGGAYGFSDLPRGPNIDPMRVAAQVASGIGFIGAGAILRDGTSVRGLTTAASLWASAALGMVVGAAAWAAAAGGLAVVLGTLVIVRYVAPLLPGLGGHARLVRIDYERGHGTLGPILASVRAAGGRVGDLNIDDGDSDGPGRRRVEIAVRVRRPEELERLIGRVEERPEVHRAAILS